MQDALAKAYDALPTTSVANMRGWLFRIAHNKAIAHLRRANHQPIEQLDEYPLSSLWNTAILRVALAWREVGSGVGSWAAAEGVGAVEG